MSSKDVITCTTLQSGTHTLWLLRDVRDRYALIEVAISCKVAQLSLRHDFVKSHTGSKIVTHVRVDQSVKPCFSYPSLMHKRGMAYKSGGARGSYPR